MKRIRAWRLLAFLLPILFCGRASALSRYLRVGFNAHMPPFQLVDENGACAGMHIDMLEAIAVERDCTFEFFPYQTDRACFEALSNGDIDLILGVIPSAVPDSRAYSCTDALTSSQLCMVVDNATLSSGNRIGTAVFASATIKHTLLANLDVHQFIAVSNQQEVYNTHLRHPGSAMIGVKDCMIYQLMQAGTDEAYTVRYNYLGALEFSMVVRSGDIELLRTLNESIAQFKASPQYESLCTKWLPARDHETRLRRIIGIIIAVSVVGGVAVLSYSLLMRRIQQVLKRRVVEQTEQIQSANRELEKQFTQIQDENDLRNHIIKYSPSGMLLFNLSYTITLMNKSACAIAGVSGSRVGQSALSIPVFSDILRREGSSIFVRGATVVNGSIRIGSSPAGARVYSYMLYQVIRYGSVAGVLLTLQDVTEADRMQQAEFEKQKSSALTRIAAGIAHEIRNPLMTIRTFAALIGSKGDDRQVQESFARYVPDEVDRINRLIENLIHYAKPARRCPERVMVDELARDCLALIKPVLKKSSFRLVQELSPELFITADRDQIRQILINILINGIEAMEKKLALFKPDSPLTLSLRVLQMEEKAAIIVRDEGVGMSAEELAVCKDPFFSTKETGTGLGLALCEQYIKENNGTLEIDSVKNEYTQISMLFERS